MQEEEAKRHQEQEQTRLKEAKRQTDLKLQHDAETRLQESKRQTDLKLQHHFETRLQEANSRTDLKLKHDAEMVVNLFRDWILCDCLIVDSNIWMNQDYESFFFVLLDLQKAVGKDNPLFFVKEQWDEICNIKKRTNYEDSSNKGARLAINRIEQFQKAELLSIPNITLDAARSSYADPPILRLLIESAVKGKSICLVSDDKELRVRARELLKERPGAHFYIIEVSEIVNQCTSYQDAKSAGLI